jgi:hypothetical protein
VLPLVSGRRPTDIDLVPGEATLIVAARIPLVWSGVDELALSIRHGKNVPACRATSQLR